MVFAKGDMCLSKNGVVEVKECYKTESEPPRFIYKVYSFSTAKTELFDEAELVKLTKVY